jgi:hypothetical protein
LPNIHENEMECQYITELPYVHQRIVKASDLETEKRNQQHLDSVNRREERSRGSVMVAKEHGDASPDDVEPSLLLLEQPAESSSPGDGPLLPLAPQLIHPV